MCTCVDVCGEIEESKFLGGDMDNTHRVKGLDYAFANKVSVWMCTCIHGCARGICVDDHVGCVDEHACVWMRVYVCGGLRRASSLAETWTTHTVSRGSTMPLQTR